MAGKNPFDDDEEEEDDIDDPYYNPSLQQQQQQHQHKAAVRNTNPFADDDEDQQHVTSTRTNSRTATATTKTKTTKTSVSVHSTNVSSSSGAATESYPSINSTTNVDIANVNASLNNNNNNNANVESPIWAARNVEWPLPNTLSVNHFTKLMKVSHRYNNMNSSDTSNDNENKNALDMDDDFFLEDATTTTSSNNSGYTTGIASLFSRALNPTTTTTTTNNNNNEFIIKSTSPGSPQKMPLNHLTSSHISDAQKKYHLLSPASRCIAASNGWIVSVLECPYYINKNNDNTNTNNNTTTASLSSSSDKEKEMLRVISRWNVYRDTSTSGGSGAPNSPSSNNYEKSAGTGHHEVLLPLPSPTIPFQHANNTGSRTTTTRTISGVFIDPTGCHVFISSYNGEAYYLHSSSKRVVKLPGFGSGVGMNTPDSYITAVAWDKERGTEGSTKRILLGTNHGEIYEYSLTASSFFYSSTQKNNNNNDNTSNNNKKKEKDGEAGGGGGGENDTKKKDDPKNKNNALSSSPSLDTEDIKVPVLLYILKTTTFKSNKSKKKEEVLVPVDTPITGMHFERSQGGNQVTILVVTSGKRRSTMFHTFQGSTDPQQQQQHATQHNTQHQQSIISSVSRNDNMAFLFRSAFSSSSTSKHCNTIRLSGSIDFADLKICQDSFAIRTEAGIYYGSIHKKSLTSTLAASQEDEDDEGEFGLLPYDKISNMMMMMMRKKHSMKNNNNIEPVSISLTPHHFITLKSDGEVTFINRVSCKAIQRERVLSSVGLSVDYYNTNNNNNNELIMDVRRPDQVWLRQGYTLMHISSSMEDRDVWRYSLERCLVVEGKNPTFITSKSASTSFNHHHHQEEKKEDLAFEVTKSKCSNSTQKSIVGVIRAEYHLARGRPEMAAKHFAQAPSILSPFSSIATRLALPSLFCEDKGSNTRFSSSLHNSNESRELLAHSNVALITYLMDKFRQASSKNDLVQCAMLGAWLVELYLHEKEREDNNNYNNKKKKRSSAGGPYNNNSNTSTHNKTIPTLGSFLSNNYQYLDVQTTIRILSSHDAKATDCATYAANSGDLKTAINACFSTDLGKAGAMDALKILNDTSLELAEPFYYKHAYTLLCRAPMQAARSFLARYPHGLLPTKLLPAFMNYERKRMEVKKERLMELLEQEEEHEDNNNIMESTTSSSPHNRNTSSSTKEPVKDIVIGSSGVEVSFDRKRLSSPNTNKKNGALSTNDYFIEDDKAVIKYLEGAIKLGCQNTAVYNYLISLYAAMEDEGPLFRFLSANVPPSSTSVMLSAVQQNQYNASTTTKFNSSSFSSSSSSSKIDLSHALRVVIKTGRHFRSAVKLYMGFGLRQQAVELALKVDPTLARELARESVEEEERKRLWLMIARSAAADDSTASEGEVGVGGGGGVHNNNNNKNKRGRDVVAKVVSVIKDCGSDVLSIEDVLPFLPDFAQIDEFKEEICSALTSYSSKIDQYMKEMNECDLTCDMLRNEIHRLRTHDTSLLPNAKCAFTQKLVLHQDEPFYVFPSGFVILQKPLEKEVKMFLNEGQRKRVEEIERQMKDYLVLLSSNTNNTNNINTSNRSHNNNNNNNVVLSKEEIQRKMDDLQKEMDGLIAAECPLTGSVMVESIDRTFLESLEEDEEYE